MFNESSNDVGLFPGGRQDWEPRDATAFSEQDPLNPYRRDWGETLRSFYNAEIEFTAWSRLPPLLRAQSWRERELADFIRTESFRQGWDEHPALEGLKQMSVGRRSWETVGLPGIGITISQSRGLKRYREAVCAGQFIEALKAYNELGLADQQLLRWHPLAIVLGFRSLSEEAATIHAHLHLERIQIIKSHIHPLDAYGLNEAAPLVLEESRESSLRSNILARSTLQGGQRIYTKPKGQTVPGTITAIVKYICRGQTCTGLFAPQHVLQNAGELVYQNGSKIGEVVYSNRTLDIALAELTDTIPWRQEILNRNLDPAPPISPVSGMPAEYYGATSQKIQESYIGLVYISPPSFYKHGNAPVFEIEGTSAHGDSGALVLSGHNQRDAISPDLTRHAPGLQGNQLAAILGMLVAGVNATNRCDKPATILATSAKDIEATLKNDGYAIEWLTR